MIKVRLHSVGILAPGLAGWRETASLLRKETAYTASGLSPLKPTTLKPNERRRTTNTIKLALEVADEALKQWPNPQQLISVFSSSEGDLEIVDQICTALSQQGRPVSPTQFHNSVHNAPAGYWSIGADSRQASTSLGGLNGCFAAGLMEASVQTAIEGKPALMVCYDLPPPKPLADFIHVRTPIAVALLLSADNTQGNALADIALRPGAGAEENRMTDDTLEALRLAAPAGRSLPLLQAVANRTTAKLSLPYLPDLGLQLEVSPC
ncbi:MAG: beta-ketoacyl synthase chain length factor [Candidatus Thiodiazotropha sp. (ex Epidulcina cf. delphinae)]|nr:beta-ketoacyl synthase chain length factor [Candidatus Thiodiazotropha sp. (ex Epidulcina cf. delphinae)]